MINTDKIIIHLNHLRYLRSNIYSLALFPPSQKINPRLREIRHKDRE